MSKATACIEQRALNARNFFQQPDKILAIGKSTPWEDPADIDVSDRNPPTPTGYETDIEEPIAYKKIDLCYLCKKDKNGTLTYREQKFITTQDLQTAIDGLYDCVYVKGSFIYDEVPLKTYRQVGLYSCGKVTYDENNVSYPLGTEGHDNIVTDPGILAVIDYRKPQPRDWDQTETFEIMIQF